jgi:hypothetical protein
MNFSEFKPDRFMKILPGRSHFCAAILMSCALWMASARADGNPPERLTYQGFLVDGNGLALGNAAPKNYDVIFRIYDAQAAGNLKWSEQQTVTVDKGYFSVLLGEGAAVGSEAHDAISSVFTAPDASDRYVGMTVKGIGTGGTDADILPRLRMLSAPYSYLAKSAMTANALASGANITSGTVPDARLSTNVALLNASQTFSGVNNFGGGATVPGANVVEFGQGVAGKGVHSGKIGYETFTPGSLDIVGAGPSNNHAVRIWAEAGTAFSGPVTNQGETVNGSVSATGSVSANTFNSPKFHVDDILPAALATWYGRSATFTYNGGTLVITMSVSGYVSAANRLYFPRLLIDGGEAGSCPMYVNIANAHMTFPVRTFVYGPGVFNPGTHTIALDANGVTNDAGDFSQVTLIEYPF